MLLEKTRLNCRCEFCLWPFCWMMVSSLVHLGDFLPDNLAYTFNLNYFASLMPWSWNDSDVTEPRSCIVLGDLTEWKTNSLPMCSMAASMYSVCLLLCECHETITVEAKASLFEIRFCKSFLDVLGCIVQIPETRISDLKGAADPSNPSSLCKLRFSNIRSREIQKYKSERALPLISTKKEECEICLLWVDKGDNSWKYQNSFTSVWSCHIKM